MSGQTAYTLQDAYNRLQIGILDDPNKRKFTDAVCHPALKVAMTQCVSDLWDQAKSPRFLIEEDISTAADGTLDLDTLSGGSILRVIDVLHRVSSGWTQPAIQIPRTSRRLAVEQAVDLTIFYLEDVAIPAVASTSNYLTGGGATQHAGAWNVFDEWVVCRAAADLAGLDRSNVQNPRILRMFEQAREAALQTGLPGNGGRAFPGSHPRISYQLYYDVVGKTLTCTRR